MEKSHLNKVRRKFQWRIGGKRVICLDIPDNYEFMDPELIRLLETRVGPDSLTVARVPAETKVTLGDQVRISAQLARLHFFDPSTELPITG